MPQVLHVLARLEHMGDRRQLQAKQIVRICGGALGCEQLVARGQRGIEVIEERTDGGRSVLPVQHRELRWFTNATATQLTQQNNNAAIECPCGRKCNGGVDTVGINRGGPAFTPDAWAVYA